MKVRLFCLYYIVFCCLLANVTLAQESPWFNINSVNESKPGSVYKFSFIHLTDTHIGEGVGDYGSPGFEDVAPEGDVGYAAERLRRFVQWVNDNYQELNVDFVAVSGDLTDSGERSEFLKFKEIMSDLEIPYVPLIGNHDVWPYVDGWVADRPYGDSLINVLFQDVFEDVKLFFDDWDDGTRLSYNWNPEAERFNYLQNFRATYKGFHLLFLDFDPRYPAANDEPGIGPEAQIMDFEGGTWRWLQHQLTEVLNLEDQNIFLISHHPPSMDLWSAYNAFSIEEREAIMDFLFPYKNHLAYWLAGHIHRNKVYPAKTGGLHPFNVVVCAETDANKSVEQGVFRIIEVYESSISTSVSDHMLDIGLDIYPNPGSGRYTIYIDGNHDQYLTASLFDTTGKLVHQQKLKMLAGS